MTNKIGTWRNEALVRMNGDRNENSIAINAILKSNLQKDQVWILSNFDQTLNAHQIADLESSLERLIMNEPLAYILEEAEFFGYSFRVTPDVLIPRPETELLVENVLDWISRTGKTTPYHYLDIGTGSGCIPISIKKHHAEIQAIAVDISRKALRVAKQNARLHEVHGINFVQADLISALKGPFNIITGNLPYIPTAELKNLRVAEKEPWLALDGGGDGLRLYKTLFDSLASILNSSALCIFEIHFDQGQRIQKMAEKYLKTKSVKIIKDYAGFERFLRIEV